MPKVLVAIDGSDHANQAFSRAVELFGPTAEYVVVSVVPPWSPAVALGANADLDLPDSAALGSGTHGGTQAGGMPFAPTPQSVDATMQGLYAFYRRAQEQAAVMAGVKAQHVIEEAKPRKRRIGRAICEVAEEQGADVVVVGPHGASYAGEALLGSVSRYVVHNAPCPVLVSRDSS